MKPRIRLSNFSIIVPPPTISEQPMGTSIKVDESASLRCTGHGYGKLEIVWRRVKHSMPVTAEVTEEISVNSVTSTLKFTRSAGHYSGQYYCVVKNEVGENISQIANLSIQGNINNKNIIIH